MNPNGSKFYEHLDSCSSEDEVEAVIEAIETPRIEDRPKPMRNRLVKPAPRDLHADHGSNKSASSGSAKMRIWLKQHITVDLG